MQEEDLAFELLKSDEIQDLLLWALCPPDIKWFSFEQLPT